MSKSKSKSNVTGHGKNFCGTPECGKGGVIRCKVANLTGAVISVEEDEEGASAPNYKTAKEDPYFRNQRNLYDDTDYAHLSEDENPDAGYLTPSIQAQDGDNEDAEVLSVLAAQAEEEAEGEQIESDETGEEESEESEDTPSNWHIARETNPMILLGYLQGEDESVKPAAVRNPRMPLDSILWCYKEGMYLESVAANPSTPLDIVHKIAKECGGDNPALYGVIDNPNKLVKKSWRDLAQAKIDKYYSSPNPGEKEWEWGDDEDGEE